LTENQLYRYVKEARRRRGVTGLITLLLEMRLDTLCFALGFAKLLLKPRQLVNHGHITINNSSKYSFQCRLNDIISVKIKVVRKLY
jgi:small subunit ribosomal protein S4